MWRIVSCKALPDYCKIQEILCFPLLCLKECSESVLWGTLHKYYACQRKCRRTAPANKNQLVAKCFASGRAFVVWLTR